jgi:hypothetical protein
VKESSPSIYVSLSVAMNCERMICYSIKIGLPNSNSFRSCLLQAREAWDAYYVENVGDEVVFVNQMNSAHDECWEGGQQEKPKERVTEMMRRLGFYRIFLPQHNPQLNPCLAFNQRLTKMIPCMHGSNSSEEFVS